MFRTTAPADQDQLSFPRVCGDVPRVGGRCARKRLFSPRMRGCSSQNRLSISLPPVFPAYAGMFLGLSSEGSSTACFPRVCGDVPSGSSLQSGAVKFSPRMRGCSQLHRPIPRSHHVFPAYAGMFPRLSFKPIWVGSFPRIRGDVPTRGFTEAARAAFSPHTRGCSEEDLEQAQCHLVFPAYARMFPTWATTTGTWKGFPRIRGDVPLQLPGQGAVLPFSPHTRGYSCECSTSGAGGAVFPACAGMFLVATAVTTLRQCFPRVRGDVLPVWL